MRVSGSKKTHWPKNASTHVLARVRREIGARQKECREALGLAVDTVKGITSERSNFTAKAARIVSGKTGVAVSCLLENNPNRPLLAVNGKRWNKKFYDDFQTPQTQKQLAEDFNKERASQYLATRTINYQRILSLKVARAVIAAYAVGQADSAYVKISKALGGIEADFIDIGKDKAGTRKSLRDWDINLQVEIGRIKPSQRNMMRRWAVIWKNFYSAISTIYGENAKKDSE